MTKYERAAQIWSVLALAATKKQILSYYELGKFVGVQTNALGRLLEPIQAFCQLKKLPPLTVIVVQQNTGMPGTGFIAAADIPKAQSDVFRFNWIKLGAPKPERMEEVLNRAAT